MAEQGAASDSNSGSGRRAPAGKPAQFAAFLHREITKHTKSIRRGNITADS